jgi:fatty acid desaturase
LEIEIDKVENVMGEKEKRQELARKVAKSKIDFLRHLATYAFVMVVLAVINNVTDFGGYQWWLWPAGIWGVFVIVNFLKIFVFKGGALRRYEERQYQKELEKMERDNQG